MIKVNVIKEKKYIREITISGHALYADFGKDIVCAAVSSTIITTINGLLMIKKNIEFQQHEDLIKINVSDNDEITFQLLTNMVNNLQQLAISYKDNIKITIKEG